MKLVRWTGGAACVAMLTSGVSAVAGSLRISDDFAIIGYVGLVAVAMEWTLTLITNRMTERWNGRGRSM